ncbi:MAG: prepilin peptidase [Candidatus Levyibacteriota bacterium]|jgi:prepilin signal peptidase PulO-like enzyme (type II secretory pathway)
MVLLLFILGLFLGSFLGVLVDRLPRNETVIKGRSHCEFCQKELKAIDLIPVLSFISTKGKCRYCKHQLPYFYPAIEVSTGILFVLTYIFPISNPQLLISVIYHLIIVSGLIVIFCMDFKYGLILDKILFPLVGIIFLYLLFFNPQSLFINLACGVLAFFFFLITSLVFKLIRGKDGMGGGDIKLAFVLGLFLGFPNIVIALYLAFLTGAIVGIILILWKKKSFQNTTLPFGPFLILGTLVCLFWGDLILVKLLLLLVLR